MDAVDLESIPSQIGTGIIRIQDQSIIKVNYYVITLIIDS